jgi:hypothetical protein
MIFISTHVLNIHSKVIHTFMDYYKINETTIHFSYFH